MNYKDVIDFAIADLDDFFDESHTSHITAETTTKRMMSATGIDEGRKLLVEKYLADTDICSLEQILLCLLVAGHEMCHLMNNHNKRSEWQAPERKALEMWADFFGTRVAFCLITHGERVKGVIASTLGPLTSPNSLPREFFQEHLLTTCGNALDLMYAQFSEAKKSDRYPSASERMLTIMAGTLSFFYREFGRVDEDWTFYVLRHVAFGRSWFVKGAEELKDYKMDDSQFSLINNVHKDIAGIHASISPGLRPAYERLIGTGYRNTEKGRRLAAKALDLEFSKWRTKFGPETQRFLKGKYR